MFGAGVTWLFSRHYYKKAGDDLKRAADSLSSDTQLILYGLEQAGLVELVRKGKRIISF